MDEMIEKIASRIPQAKLERAAFELSSAYRAQSQGRTSSKPFMWKEEHKIAYLALRMPATYAAILQVLRHIPVPIHTLLDIGSGPGTAYIAANTLFSLREALLVEKDATLIKLGKELCNGPYVEADIASFVPKKSYDLVIAAYSLSEFSDLDSILPKLWEAANPLFCIIESGTPYGFKTILQARKFLIEQKAHILAPCTHENPCPWSCSQEWCHFSTRLERTRLQKKVKGALLGYEDEKYSYLIASKIPLKRPQSRIVKTPQKRSGFINFTLCNAQGIQTRIFSKKQGDAYSSVKKLDWGDGL